MPQKTQVVNLDGLRITYVDGANNNYVNTLIYIHDNVSDYMVAQLSLPNDAAENLFETIVAGAAKIHGAEVEMIGYGNDNDEQAKSG